MEHTFFNRKAAKGKLFKKLRKLKFLSVGLAEKAGWQEKFFSFYSNLQ